MTSSYIIFEILTKPLIYAYYVETENTFTRASSSFGRLRNIHSVRQERAQLYNYSLKKILHIPWEDKVPDTKVFDRSGLASIQINK